MSKSPKQITGRTRTIKEAFSQSSSQATPLLQSTARKSLLKSLHAGGPSTNDEEEDPYNLAEEGTSSGNKSKTKSKAMEELTKNMEKKMRDSFEQILSKMMGEISDILDRVSAAEERIDEIENFCLDQRQTVEELKDTVLTLQLQMEDGENRSRRSNIRLRGIPENIQDISTATTAIFQDLIPNIQRERLELDRAHRALTKLKPDGPPRDIVVKMHYYSTKEAIMKAAREKAKMGALTFQGSQYQIFSDISPSTIARRREMKPSLAILIANNITYKWGFPFRIIFQYKTRWHSAASAPALADLICHLGLKGSGNPKRSREPTTPDTHILKKISARNEGRVNERASEQDQAEESIEVDGN